MDLISITQILWRRKIVTIPLIVLTALGAFYVVKVKPPVYQAQSSLLMVPPTPPTAAQIAADPQLGKINPNNPYLNYGDLSVVADTLIDVVTDTGNQQALVAKGADPRYELTLSTDFGNPPIIDITGIGKTPQIAMRSAELVTKNAQTDLITLQADQGVNSLYMIKATQLVTPSQATQSVSSKLRTLIAVLAAGILALFVAVSLLEAVDKRRRNRREKDPAEARRSQPDRPRPSFLSRYRTRPGWAPDDTEAPAAERSGAHGGAASPGPGSRPDREAPRQPVGGPLGRPDREAPRQPVGGLPVRPGPLDRPPVRPAAPAGRPARGDGNEPADPGRSITSGGRLSSPDW